MLSDKQRFSIHINAAFHALRAGNYAVAEKELALARAVYYEKNRGVSLTGVWSEAFSDIAWVTAQLRRATMKKNPSDFEFRKIVVREGYPRNGNANKRRLYYGYLIIKDGKTVDGPFLKLHDAKKAARDFHGYTEVHLRKNHHLSAGSLASGKVRVIRPFGLRKSGEDLYLVDGRGLKPTRKNGAKKWRLVITDTKGGKRIFGPFEYQTDAEARRNRLYKDGAWIDGKHLKFMRGSGRITIGEA